MAAKDASSVAQKWIRVTPQRSQDFEEGVQNPRKPWKASTLSAAQRHTDGVQKAIQEKRFEKGVSKTSEEDWKQNTISKGRTRWGEGVAIAQDKYARNFAPYLSVMTSIDPGPKFPKGDPRNIDRVKKIAMALHKKKVSG